MKRTPKQCMMASPTRFLSSTKTRESVLNLYPSEKCEMTKSEGEKRENKRKTIVRNHRGIEKGRVIHLRDGVIHKRERESDNSNQLTIYVSPSV